MPPPSQLPPTSAQQKAKRKRLSKACDACHKSKRRCDGTSPCANCDFAGKMCIYTDASGQHVAPPLERSSSVSYPDASGDVALGEFSGGVGNGGRKRKAIPPPSGAGRASQSEPLRGSSSASSTTDLYSALPPDVVPTPSPLSDPALVHELVNLFFRHLHPYNLILHRPSFLHDLTLNNVSPYLLLSVCALAAPLSSNVAFSMRPSHCAGEDFAALAKQYIFDAGGRLRVRPSLEVAQALPLLALHDCIGRQAGRRTDMYQHIALDILDMLGVQSFDRSSQLPTLGVGHNRRDWIERETCRRVFYVIYMIELLGSAFSHRPLSHQEADLRIYLPTHEHLYELGMDPSFPQREYLVPHNATPGGISQASELGFLVRAIAVYTRISDGVFALRHGHDDEGAPRLAADRPTSTRPSRSDIITGGEDDLKVDTLARSTPDQLTLSAYIQNWESSLPPALAFNDHNLQYHINRLDSGASISGWCYFYMHAIAECCVIAIEELVQPDPDRSSGSAHQHTLKQALSNLKVIMRTLGKTGRNSIMMGVLLETMVKCSVAISGGQPEAEIVQWCSEYEATWGITIEQLTSVDFRQTWVPDFPQDRLMVPSESELNRERLLSQLARPRDSFSGQTGSSDDRTRVSSPPPESVSSAGGYAPARDSWSNFGQNAGPLLPKPSLQRLQQTPSYDHLRPIQTGQSRSHSFPSSGSSNQLPKLSRPGYDQRRTYPSSREEDAEEDGEDVQLPPPVLSKSGDSSPSQQQSQSGRTALPSLQDVGLLGESPTDSGRRTASPVHR